MSLPIISYVAASPVGLAVIGVAGFLSYRAGKNAGMKSVDEFDKPGLGDRTVKGAMKAFYRTKKSVGNTFSKTGDKYSAMWQDVQEEVNTGK